MTQALRESNAERILEMATQAKSLKGRNIPETLVNTLGKIALEGFDLTIGSKKSLSKSMTFFQRNHHTLTFYTQYGDQFQFADYAETIKYHEPFMAIDFNTANETGQVFMYFPADNNLIWFPKTTLCRFLSTAKSKKVKQSDQFSTTGRFALL